MDDLSRDKLEEISSRSVKGSSERRPAAYHARFEFICVGNGESGQHH